MHDLSRHLDWPFFDERHRQLHADLLVWLGDTPGRQRKAVDPDAAVAEAVAELGAAGWLNYCLPYEGRLDVRAVCLVRELLAARSGLDDVAFAMQGLGSLPIALFGSHELKHRYLPRIASGEAIAAFAISEDGAGTDVAAMASNARQEGNDWVIEGSKSWISNAPIADVYVVFARTEEDAGSRGISAFVVEAPFEGLEIEATSVSAPHPIGTLRFGGLRVPSDHLIGARGDGFKIAMVTLEHFRPTVGAAALGFARRAFAEALEWVQARRIAGKRLADYDLTRERLADMAMTIDASAFFVYRAGWLIDTSNDRHRRQGSMAKLAATEGAQRVVDDAIQLLGARGVVAESPLELLYREVRALRIYEGTSEVQKLIIARELLSECAAPSKAPA